MIILILFFVEKTSINIADFSIILINIYIDYTLNELVVGFCFTKLIKQNEKYLRFEISTNFDRF